MGWSFAIGRLFGSEIRIHATFFLLLAWIGLSAYLADGAAAAVTSLLFVIVLFACVVAHEFGHALMARRFGIHTADVTLLPIGGVARLERMPDKPGQEVLVAVAGPAVNVVVWAVLSLAFGLAPPGAEIPLTDIAAPGWAADFARAVASVNLSLVLFNLIPAFPMDGGRVLRALLSMQFGRVRATRYAALAGQAIAVAFGLAGLLLPSPILVLVALFVFVAAASERADVSLRDLARHYLARDAAITAYETLGPADTLDTAAQALIRTTQHEFPVLDPEGHLTGFLTRSTLVGALARGERTRPVAEIMVTPVPTLPARAPLDAAIDLMQRQSAPAVGVTGPDGAFLGYITPENLGELMIVARSPGRGSA